MKKFAIRPTHPERICWGSDEAGEPSCRNVEPNDGDHYVEGHRELFDGFSIGSNDLTQLTLGVDRDSATVAFDFDERDPGMLKMLKLAIEGCRHNGVHSGICGQAPSDYPEIAAELVRLGIDSISVNPDTVVKTTLAVLEVEGKLAAQERRDVA